MNEVSAPRKSNKAVFFTVVTTSSSYSIDKSKWSCKCFTAISLRLPCQHIMFVSQHVLKHRVLPVKAVPVR